MAAKQSPTEQGNRSLSSVIPPVLLECLAQVKDVRTKIDTLYESSTLQKDLCSEEYSSFDGKINDIAGDISEMIRAELLNSIYYLEYEGRDHE